MLSHTFALFVSRRRAQKNSLIVLGSSCSGQLGSPGDQVTQVYARLCYLIMNGVFLIWGPSTLFVELK